jgi:hypothetical protein
MSAGPSSTSSSYFGSLSQNPNSVGDWSSSGGGGAGGWSIHLINIMIIIINGGVEQVDGV